MILLRITMMNQQHKSEIDPLVKENIRLRNVLRMCHEFFIAHDKLCGYPSPLLRAVSEALRDTMPSQNPD